MNDITINVMRDFTRQPFGRYKADGDRSGEVFRDEILVPAIKQHDHVTVDLSGYYYYGSSFLEEVFGGLLRANFKPDELKSKIKVVHKELPSIVAEANAYMSNEDMGIR